MTLFEFALLVVVALVVWAIVSGKIDSKKLKDAIADLKDDGKLNNSNVQPATVTPEHLQAVAEIVRAAQPAPRPPMRAELDAIQAGFDKLPPLSAAAPAPAVAPEYSGVGDPPSQEVWAKWLATLDPMRRSFYPPIWKPTPVSQANPAMDVPVTFINGVATEVLTREAGRKLVNGELGRVFSFPLGADVTMVTIAETSGGGDQARYNLWGSLEPNGAAAEPIREFQYNAAVLRVAPGTPFVNVRQLIAAGPFYIQAN